MNTYPPLVKKTADNGYLLECEKHLLAEKQTEIVALLPIRLRCETQPH
jgi:hypothetical protein